MPLPRPLRDLWLARLVRKSQRGDRAAFATLYRALHPLVWRFVARRVRRPSDAEEIVAQVFFRLLERLDQIDPARGTVVAYALTMARHALIDRSRLPSPASLEVAEPELVDPARSALDALVSAAELAAVRAELEALTPEVREALALRFGEGLRFPEIAQVLGVSEAAARQRVSRALREIRQRLGSAEEKELAHEG